MVNCAELREIRCTQHGPKSVNDELTRVGTVLATATQTIPKIEPPIAPKRKKLTIVGITSFMNSAGSWMSCR